MKVYVAEKPKLGRAIAEQLMRRTPKTDSGKDFVCGRDWAVCWAAGHIFEQVEPDYYIGAKYPNAEKDLKGRFSWTFDHLPLLPGANDWAIRLVAEKSGLFGTIKKFVGKATVVVNAGDPDREGQLLIDEILDEIGNKKPVRRVLISGFDELSVNNGLANERDNAEFAGMRNAALSRSRADWLCGMNFSRAATLQARISGYRGVVPIGRVQTAILGLIVLRHAEIARFKPVDYFSVTAKMRVAGGEFVARWSPDEGQPGLDSEGRLLDQRVAEQLAASVKGRAGKIAEYSDEERQEGAPLPFSLDKLQMLASRKYGYKSDDVLKAVQSLYETHSLVSYPRSDCQYLPTGQFKDAPEVIGAVKGNLRFAGDVVGLIDAQKKSRAWNDGKVTAHHAIIPTATKSNIEALTAIERNLYDEICRRYLAQFMPPRRYRAVKALVDVGGQRFVATGTTTIYNGWRLIYGNEGAAAGEETGGDSGEGDGVLPLMKVGEQVSCADVELAAKKTAPPALFTDATLLEAMINIHKFVTDGQVKAMFQKMLSDKKAGDEDGGCGLGTPATRHTFVPKLVDAGLVKWIAPTKGGKGKESFLAPTDAGAALIGALPAELGRPDMTAVWEASMREIESGRATVEQFLGMQGAWITKVIGKIRANPLVLPVSASVTVKPGGFKGVRRF